jgi:hypothetical protein
VIHAGLANDSEHIIMIQKMSFVKRVVSTVKQLIPTQRFPYLDVFIDFKRSPIAFSEKN